MKAPVRIVTLLGATALWLLATTSAALADSPVGEAWPAPPERSILEWVLIFGGGTVGLFVLISLFGLLTARNNYVPPPPSTELATTPGNSPAQH